MQSSAVSKVCLSFSGVPISDFTLPERTATPIPTRAIGDGSLANWARAAASLTTSSGTMAASNADPVAITTSCGAVPKRSTVLCPEVRSNSAAISVYAAAAPPPAMTWSSALCARFMDIKPTIEPSNNPGADFAMTLSPGATPE